MTYRELYVSGRERLEAAGISEATLDARLLLEHVTDLDSCGLYLRMEEDAVESCAAAYEEFIVRREEGEPLQYITGVAGFMGLEFHVDRHVLIPRQDTECLCERALQLLEELSEEGGITGEAPDVLDMCSGSGCIIISLKALGDIGRAVGADISPEALAVARENALANGQKDIDFLFSDMFENINGKFDMIVSNPPYIPSRNMRSLMREVRDHEPLLALAGGEDGLDFYRVLCSRAPEHIRCGGHMLLETGHDQAECVMALMRENGWRRVRSYRDLSGMQRVVSGTWEGSEEDV